MTQQTFIKLLMQSLPESTTFEVFDKEGNVEDEVLFDSVECEGNQIYFVDADNDQFTLTIS